jgi:hypothetical protein
MWWTSGRRANQGVMRAKKSTPKFWSQVSNLNLQYILFSIRHLRKLCPMNVSCVYTCRIIFAFEHSCFVTKCRNTYTSNMYARQ